MLRVDYFFEALQPIHTGSDENFGILKTLRRQKAVLHYQETIKSRFTSEQQKLKRQAVALLLFRLWDKMQDKARPSIYEEISSKLLASTAVRNKQEFLQMLCRRLNIREATVDASRRFDVVDILELFDDAELLQMVRIESQYIMALFRKMKDETIRWSKDSKGKSAVAKNTVLGDIEESRSPEVLISDELEKVLLQDFSYDIQNKHIDYVPTISGNSIRGVLRRMAMYDYAKIAGITSFNQNQYHMLFTGGTLSDSTSFEDLGRRQELIQHCPMIGLFGSAIGNQTIQGELKVGQPRLLCREYKTSQLSYHEQIDVIFSTRHDSQKLENGILIEETSDEKHQMKYEYEVFSPGSVFEHSFACTSDNDLLISAFWRVLELFKESPYITAKGSVGHGEIALEKLEIPRIGSSIYISHVKLLAEQIRNYWNGA